MPFDIGSDPPLPGFLDKPPGGAGDRGQRSSAGNALSQRGDVENRPRLRLERQGHRVWSPGLPA